MAIWKQIGSIFVLAAVAALLSAFFHPKRPAWFEVESVADLQWQLSLGEANKLAESESILWVDSRKRSKFESEHIDGAVLLNAEEWGDLMFQNMDTIEAAMGDPVVVYCDGSECRRSSDIAQRLRELLGMEPVYILKGEWREVVPSP